jgi:hypothetical protein
VIGANGITLNLNGHFINGSFGVNDGTMGVIDGFNTDTIENGYVHGFTVGVVAGGTSDTVTKLQVNATLRDGIDLTGFNGDKATSNTAAENFGAGMLLDGFAQTAQSNHLLNNGSDGMDAIGGADKVLDNVADGNADQGIHVGSLAPATVTGNTANYNTDYGIQAVSPQIDGGTNTAKGNTNPRQCAGVVCS